MQFVPCLILFFELLLPLLNLKLSQIRVCPKFCVNTEMRCK